MLKSHHQNESLNSVAEHPLESHEFENFLNSRVSLVPLSVW